MFIFMPPPSPVTPVTLPNTQQGGLGGNIRNPERLQIPNQGNDRFEPPRPGASLEVGTEVPDTGPLSETRKTVTTARGGDTALRIGLAIKAYTAGRSATALYAGAGGVIKTTTTGGKILKVGGGVISIGTSAADLYISQQNYNELCTPEDAIDAISPILREEDFNEKHFTEMKRLVAANDFEGLRAYLLKPKDEDGCGIAADIVDEIIGKKGKNNERGTGLIGIRQDKDEARRDLTANKWCTYTSGAVGLGIGTYAGIAAAVSASATAGIGGAVLAGVATAIPIIGIALAVGAGVYLVGKAFKWW